MRSHVLLTLSLVASVVSVSCRGPSAGDAPGHSTVAEQSADELSGREAQRIRNHEAWLEHGADLARDHPGAWVLIAGGEVLGSWKRFDLAWRRASALPESEQHAYLYRAGVDDAEVTFHLSPFLSNRPRWNQLGRRIRRPWKLTIAAVGDTWYRDEKQISWGDAGARVRSTSLDEGAERDLRAVASNLFDYDLTLRPSDARALGLGRFTAPLPAYYNDSESPCEKVLLRIRIPELEIDAPAVAFVLPEEVVR